MDIKTLDQLYRDWLIHVSHQRQKGMISDRLDLTPVAMFIDFCHDRLKEKKQEQPVFEVGDTVAFEPEIARRNGFDASRRGKVETIKEAYFPDGEDLIKVLWKGGMWMPIWNPRALIIISKGSKP